MSVSDRLRRGNVAAVAMAAAMLTFAGASPAAGADQIAAISDGAGGVALLWVPEDGSWPAGGWRLDRIGAAGAATIALLGPGQDRDALGRLSREEVSGIAAFADKLRRGVLTEEERQAADTVLVIAAITNLDYGRALGLRFRDVSVPLGRLYYRLTALDAAGRPLRIADSDSIDASVSAPLPHPPEAIAVDVGGDGFVISWNDPPNLEAAPIVGYRVVRVEEDAETSLTPELHLRATQEEGPTRLVFLDREPVRDRSSAYDLTSVDLFGRSSAPKRIDVTLGELARAATPAGLAVEAGVESALVLWSAIEQPGVAGYVVERSLFIAGPYEVLTPDGLPRDATSFEDAGLSPGTAYFFRVRVFDADGNLGHPTLPAKAVPSAAAPPAAPLNLAVDAGPSRVALTWDEPPKPVAGYFVYRRLDGETLWNRLNGTVTPEPMFFDRFERGAFSDATLFYRVQAIGYDNQEGAYSAEVAVSYGDVALPPAPSINAADGDEGATRLVFQPGAPEADSDRFVVLRSDDQQSPGLVVADALPSAAREFVDTDVTPGSVYWYQIVALDAAGNRGDPSNRVSVAVGPPQLAPPPAPTAAYHDLPFPYVELTLPALPEKALALVEARVSGGGKWLIVAGPIGEVGTINLTSLPPDATEIEYRLFYQTANGARGPPSAAVTVGLR